MLGTQWECRPACVKRMFELNAATVPNTCFRSYLRDPLGLRAIPLFSRSVNSQGLQKGTDEKLMDHSAPFITLLLLLPSLWLWRLLGAVLEARHGPTQTPGN